MPNRRHRLRLSLAAGAIAVWRRGDAGHVAIVRTFSANTVVIAEANWGAPKAGCEEPESACFGQTENFSRWQARVFQFEQAGQVFGRLRASTSTPAAALLLGDLHLVLLFRLLQQLERSLLG